MGLGRVYCSVQSTADEAYRRASETCPRPASPNSRLPRPALRMAKTPCTPRELVERLDARHDELILKLDELNAQIEAALAEFSRSRDVAPRDDEARKAA
jgi:hypothetical protein